MQNQLVTTPLSKPTLTERIAVSRIRRRGGWLARARKAFCEAFYEYESVSIPIGIMSAASLIVGIIFLFTSTAPFSGTAILLGVPLSLLTTLLVPFSKSWGERLQDNVKRLSKTNAMTVPREISRLVSLLEGIKYPELVVLEALSLSDTLEMLRLSRTLADQRPVVGRPVAMEVSGHTSETISRVVEALGSRPDKMIIRI